MNYSSKEFLKQPFIVLLFKSTVKNFIALSVDVVVLFFVAIALFSILSLVFQRTDLEFLKSLVIGRTVIIILFIVAFVFILTPTNLILGFLSGTVMALLLYSSMKIVKKAKLQKLLGALFGGIIIGVTGNLNVIIFDYFTSTTSHWEYVDLGAIFSSGLSKLGNDPVMGIWIPTMTVFLVILPILMGMTIGVNLSSKLETHDI